MLTKEKLSEVVKKSIGSRSYSYKVSPSSTKNSCTISLYSGQPNDDGLVVTIYISEGKVLGSFHMSFIPKLSCKEDREVMKMINSNLFDYFNKRIEPKYYIKLLNNDGGYLTQFEETGSWSVLSLAIAKMTNQKATFTAGEISKMARSEEFANVDLWSAAKEVEDYEQ